MSSPFFDAPRELVWKAWTDSERIAQWFGPKGVTIATETERKTFDTAHESMQNGWTGTLDQLTEYLGKA